jgi:hypothetical protein
MAYATLRYRHGSTALTSRSVQVLPAGLIQIKCTTAYQKNTKQCRDIASKVSTGARHFPKNQKYVL